MGEARLRSTALSHSLSNLDEDLAYVTRPQNSFSFGQNAGTSHFPPGFGDGYQEGVGEESWHKRAQPQGRAHLQLHGGVPTATDSPAKLTSIIYLFARACTWMMFSSPPRTQKPHETVRLECTVKSFSCVHKKPALLKYKR